MPEVYLPNEISYIMGLIKILSAAGAGRNAYTELKAQSFITIQ